MLPTVACTKVLDIFPVPLMQCQAFPLYTFFDIAVQMIGAAS